MKYMVLIYGNETTWNSWTDQDHEYVISAHKALTEDLKESGAFLSSAGLTTLEAATVTRRTGRTVITDGPFAEAKEVLAGYYLLECPSLSEATEIAARLPEAAWNTIEVRALLSEEDLGMT